MTVSKDSVQNFCEKKACVNKSRYSRGEKEQRPMKTMCKGRNTRRKHGTHLTHLTARLLERRGNCPGGAEKGKPGCVNEDSFRLLWSVEIVTWKTIEGQIIKHACKTRCNLCR